MRVMGLKPYVEAESRVSAPMPSCAAKFWKLSSVRAFSSPARSFLSCALAVRAAPATLVLGICRIQLVPGTLYITKRKRCVLHQHQQFQLMAYHAQHTKLLSFQNSVAQLNVCSTAVLVDHYLLGAKLVDQRAQRSKLTNVKCTHYFTNGHVVFTHPVQQSYKNLLVCRAQYVATDRLHASISNHA